MFHYITVVLPVLHYIGKAKNATENVVKFMRFTLNYTVFVVSFLPAHILVIQTLLLTASLECTVLFIIKIFVRK